MDYSFIQVIMQNKLPAMFATKDLATLLEIGERRVNQITRNLPYIRRGLGGSKHFLLRDIKRAPELPDQIRQRLEAALAPKLPVPAPATRDSEKRAAAIMTVGPRGERKMTSCLFILKAAAEFVEKSPLPKTAAEKDFVSLVKSGALDIPIEIRVALRGKLSPRNLRRWRQMLDADGAARLAGRYRVGRESKVEVDEPLQIVLLALIDRYGRSLGAKRARNLAATKLGRLLADRSIDDETMPA